MYDELTEVDIKKMQEEIDYKLKEVRPKLIRYLKRMIATAKVIKVTGEAGVVGLFDRVEIYYEEDDETEVVELVTTLRQDALRSYISKESPLGQALMGKKVGDRVLVKASEDYSYYVVIRSIEKGADDDSLPISSF